MTKQRKSSKTHRSSVAKLFPALTEYGRSRLKTARLESSKAPREIQNARMRLMQILEGLGFGPFPRAFDDYYSFRIGNILINLRRQPPSSRLHILEIHPHEVLYCSNYLADTILAYCRLLNAERNPELRPKAETQR